MSRTIFEALGNALVDAWYVWLLMIVLGVALASLAGWARRLERGEADDRPVGVAER